MMGFCLANVCLTLPFLGPGFDNIYCIRSFYSEFERLCSQKDGIADLKNIVFTQEGMYSIYIIMLCVSRIWT